MKALSLLLFIISIFCITSCSADHSYNEQLNQQNEEVNNTINSSSGSTQEGNPLIPKSKGN